MTDRTDEDTLRRRDRVRTQEEILRAATEVFAESGYAGARIDEIAERTSSVKRMIYYYFGSKDGLYLATLERSYREIREVEQSLDVAGLDPVAAIRRLAELTYDHHSKHEEFVRLVTIENVNRGQFIRRLTSLQELTAPIAVLLERILEDGARAGLFRDDAGPLEVHMVISALSIFPVANRHTFGFLFSDDPLDPDRATVYRRLAGDVVVGWLTDVTTHRAVRDSVRDD